MPTAGESRICKRIIFLRGFCMVFSSVMFLFCFLPIAFFLYYLAPYRMKNGVLLFVSLAFYSWGEVRYFPVMLAMILVNYFAALRIEARGDRPKIRQLWLWAAVLFNFGMLGFFKYSAFLTQNLNLIPGVSLPVMKVTLPLGISFYTFQTMSYTIDVYRRDVPAERNLIDFGAFVVLFPQLIAGPIVRYSDIRAEMHERTLSMEQIEAGVRFFLLGLASKVLIANNIGALWTDAESMGFSNLSTPLTWLAVAAYTLQIYFDFSGYSLMAIGLGKMLGFEFPKNFDFPYESKSVTEFWSRWHMTLGTWFREYVYYPLGGNRRGRKRQFLNLFLVWALTGLWHGAAWNFVLWGLYYFVLLMIEKTFLTGFLKKSRVLAHVYLLFVVMVGWALFAVTDPAELGALFKGLFVFRPGTDWMYFLRNYGVTFLLGILFSTKALKRPFERLTQNAAAAALVYGVLFFVSACYLVDATYNPFLYFRF